MEVDEYRETLSKQLRETARIGGDIEHLLTDPKYRDLDDEDAYLFDINSTDSLGNTALHLAVASGDEENVNHLIEANGCDVDPQNREGNTPLHLAVQLKDHDTRHAIVSLLVEGAGATDSIRLTNKAGQTPNTLAKIFFPDDTEVSSLTTSPARTIKAIVDRSDIARDDDEGESDPE